MRGHTLAAAAVAVLAAAGAQPSRSAAADADVLGFFHLAQSGDGRVTFASSRSVRGGEELSDVTFAGEKKGDSVHADTLRITGLRETGDGAVFDALEIAGLTGPDGFTLDRFVIDKPNAALSGVIAQMLSADGVSDDLDLGKLSDYGFDSISLEGFSADADGTQVSFGSLELSDLDAGKLAHLAFENAAGAGTDPDGQSFSFALGSWRINGVDMSGADALADADFDDPAGLQAALGESGLNNPFVKHFDNYELKDVSVDFNGVLVSLDGLEGAARQTRGGVETNETLDALKVSFDTSLATGAQAAAVLQQLGYDELEVDGHFTQRADQAQDRVTTDDYALEAKDAFRIELAYDIGGVAEYMQNAAAEGWSAGSSFDDPDTVARVLGPLMINSFQLKLIDKSLVDRAFAAAAAAQGVPEDQMRAQATAMMAMGTMMAPPGPLQVLASNAVQAATSFLQEPGTLTISIAPPKPVSVGELAAAFQSQDFDTALGLMNLEISAAE